MDDRVRAFLERNTAAAMTTLHPDGMPHLARVGVQLMDGKLWSSGTQERVRTRHLRRDPRSTLFVFDTKDTANAWQWLGLETTVTILEGADVPELSLRMFQAMQKDLGIPDGKISWFGGLKTFEEFIETMKQEKRLIYEFEIRRFYGAY
jgi:PPOX class probable F420-dependent enzyme